MARVLHQNDVRIGRPKMNEQITILVGPASLRLGAEVCEIMRTAPGAYECRRFPDGEIQIDIRESIRGRDVFLVQSTSAPVETHLMELVLFADALPDFDAIALAARIGAHGVMFDTMGKDAGSLPDHMSFMALAEYIASAKAEGLVVGLAGSLKAQHVASLVALAPDLLGFRGALCQCGDRSRDLDPVRLAAIRALIPERPHILNQPNLANLAPQSLC